MHDTFLHIFMRILLFESATYRGEGGPRFVPVCERGGGGGAKMI